MKFANSAAILGVATLCLFGCGKKTENGAGSSESPAANYPLPDPPAVVNCQPGIRGGRFVITELGEPKTFNYLMAGEASSDRLR